MALTDGIKNKLKNIANAIRSKTNKTEELTLEQMASEVEGIYSPKAEEVRKVELKGSGIKTILPSESFDVMKKVELTAVGVGGVDLTRIYTQEGADEYNEIIDADMITAEKIMNTWDLTKTNFNYAYEYGRLTFFPQVDFSNITTAIGAFSYSSVVRFPTQLDTSNCVNMNVFTCGCIALQNMPPLNLQNCVNLSNTFYLCPKIKKITLHNLQKCSNFSGTFTHCMDLEECYIDGWMQTNISINQSSKLSAESIHYIIQNAMNVEGGATARTLTLHATAKTNWQNSEYYEQDLAVLEQKGITIA